MTAPGLPPFPGPVPPNTVLGASNVPVVYPYWDWNAPSYPFTHQEKPFYCGPRPVEIRRTRREHAEARMSPPPVIPNPPKEWWDRPRYGRLSPQIRPSSTPCPPGWEQRGTYPSGRPACTPCKKAKGKRKGKRKRHARVGKTSRKRTRGPIERKLDALGHVVDGDHKSSAIDRALDQTAARVGSKRKRARRRNMTGLLGLMDMLSGNSRRQARESATATTRRSKIR